MRRFFPPVIHSRETTGNAEPLSQQFQNISRFDCKHFAIAEKLTQRQIAPVLCKNCGAAQLPVERKGKTGLLLSARGLGGLKPTLKTGIFVAAVNRSATQKQE
jgi:hypothetical protein